MIVDVVILTDNTDQVMTYETIRSLHDSEVDHQFNVIVVSSNEMRGYSNAAVNMFIDYKFNYNMFLNYGVAKCKAEWVLISNDDVKYERRWFSNILKVYEQRPDIQSFSPKDPMLYLKYFNSHFAGHQDDYYESYIVSEAFMGWSFVMRKEALDKIRPFDETFDMYYQDNDIVETMKLHGIKHALVRDSIASHLNTLYIDRPMSMEKLMKLPIDHKKFKDKWK